jgi:ubiquinone/menaquinone biosynthesis C-methylase UbiE
MNPRREKPNTFDNYADDYAALIRDPIRDQFASGSRFFFERKIHLIRDFFRHSGIDTHSLAWLDVGCGQGDLLRIGRQHFKSSAGCDPSREMLTSCSVLDVRHQPSMDALTYDNRSFDFVTAVCVYHHVPMDRRTLLTAEAFRVLKPKGIFSIIEHNPYNPVTRLIVSRTPVDADARLLTAKETERLFSDAQAKILARQYFLFLPERVYRFAGAVERALEKVPLGGQYALFGRK